MSIRIYDFVKMKYKILVVDDEPKNLKLLMDILKVNSYEVIVASNGQEAVDMTLSHKPDLVLLDLQLPVMDGLAAAQLLKNNPNTSSIPILVLSGCGLSDDKLEILKVCCDGYIGKPFDLKLLRATVEKVLVKQSRPCLK